MNRKGLKLRLSLLLLCIAALPALVACSLFFTEADMQLLDTAVAAEAERLKISVAPAEVLSIEGALPCLTKSQLPWQLVGLEISLHLTVGTKSGNMTDSCRVPVL